MARPRHAGPREGRGILKIGDAARELETTPRTLRFYEELGLITPARTAGKTRSYRAADLTRLQAALHLTELGISLRAVVTLAGARRRSRTGDSASHKVDGLLASMRRDIEEKAARCEAVLRQIDAAQALVRQCFDCQKPPRYDGCRQCPVARHVDDVQLLQLIWDRRSPQTSS